MLPIMFACPVVGCCDVCHLAMVTRHKKRVFENSVLGQNWAKFQRGPRPFLRLRASAVSLTLGLRLERLLEVLCVHTCLRTLRPGHLWSLRPVHLYELRLCRASGEGKEARALSDVRTGSSDRA
jgi:hypothetical protein